MNDSLDYKMIFTIYSIRWDSNNINLPNEIILPENSPRSLDGMADFIYKQTGSPFNGFSVKCNMTTKDLYELAEKIDEKLSKEYEEYGETNWAAQLEALKERIEEDIIFLENDFISRYTIAGKQLNINQKSEIELD